MKRKNQENEKMFSMAMPTETWLFVKQTAASQGVSMRELICSCVEKYKKKLENKLTNPETNI